MERAGRRKKSRKRKFLVFGFLLLVTGSAAAFKGQEMKQEKKKYESRMAELESEIAEEEKRTKEIEEYRDYVKSDEYAEEVARDKLGLVYDDEVLLKAKEDE